MHFGKTIQGRTYLVNGRALLIASEQKGIGVQVKRSLKVVTQEDRGVKRVFGTFALINQDIEYRSWGVML